MSAKIHIERMMYRSSIAVPGESAASYALVKLIPSADGAGKAVALNLALVLDVSGSMYEEDGTGISRLKRIQQAALSALEKLKPEDTLAIIAFAHNCQVVLPATTLAEKDKITDVINRIDMFEVDPGGTAMDVGIEEGIREVERQTAPGRLSQVVVLTDGETSGEQQCRQLAQTAAQKQIHLSMMGVGTEWNAGLIKDLAKLSEGKWYYIDVNDAKSAEAAFMAEFESLAHAGFTNVEMALRPFKDIKIKRVRQVVPEIRELKLEGGDGQPLVASLGKLEVTYDGSGGTGESSGEYPLEVQYTASGQGYVNAEVARHIDEVQIYELNKNLQEAIATNDQAEAQRVAQTIEKKGELMGPRAAKKTMLAKQVLQELNYGGRVTKKTQLAVDDAAREAMEMPVS